MDTFMIKVAKQKHTICMCVPTNKRKHNVELDGKYERFQGEICIGPPHPQIPAPCVTGLAVQLFKYPLALHLRISTPC